MIDSTLDADGERLSEFRERIEANRTANASASRRSRRRQRRRSTSASGTSAAAARCSAARSPRLVLAVVLLWTRPRRLAPGDAALERRRAASRSASARSSTRALLVVGADADERCGGAGRRPARLEAERWDAFRRYLTDFPRLQDAPPATLELWERFLVYGIAFGIAERVLQGAQLHMPRGAARPEHDLLDHARRRPRLRRDLARDQRPLVRVRLRAHAAGPPGAAAASPAAAEVEVAGAVAAVAVRRRRHS